MSRTKEHGAALDALEDLVRKEWEGVSGIYQTNSRRQAVLNVLVSSGRMRWLSTGDRAAFVPFPTPLLSKEQKANVMGLVRNCDASTPFFRSYNLLLLHNYLDTLTTADLETE